VGHALLVDGSWEVLEASLPERPRQRIGRPRVSDRAALTAIVFVLLTGVPWRMVPKEIGCSGVTAWRRRRDRQAAGVWERLHRELLRRLNAAGKLEWSRGIVDSSHIRALQGGSDRPSPVDRGRTGTKHHLIVEASGVPLLATYTGGNRNDVTQLLPLVDGIGRVAPTAADHASAPTRSSPTAATTALTDTPTWQSATLPLLPAAMRGRWRAASGEPSRAMRGVLAASRLRGSHHVRLYASLPESAVGLTGLTPVSLIEHEWEWLQPPRVSAQTGR
jgi:transposase